jgi:hypothetical protein
MPRKRRPLVRALLNPNFGPIKAPDVDDLLGTSRPTSTDRMNQLVTLGIAERVETDDGRDPLILKPKTDFEWPDSLEFPSKGGIGEE